MCTQNQILSKACLKISTSKFHKLQANKENNSKNNSIEDTYSSGEFKFKIKKYGSNNEIEPLNNKEEIKEKDAQILKNNFSLNSLNISNNDINCFEYKFDSHHFHLKKEN